MNFCLNHVLRDHNKKPIVFDAEIDLDSPIKKATGTMVFNRADFGIQYKCTRTTLA